MDRLDYDDDQREPADDRRRLKFREGWRRGANPKGDAYGPNVLDRLTWENLGYRMGKVLKVAPETFIDAMYEMCALLQREQQRRPQEGKAN